MGVLNFIILPKSYFARDQLKHPIMLFRFGSYVLVGLGVAFLAAMVNEDAGTTLANSAWLLPTVTLAILMVLLVQYIRLPGEGGSGERLDSSDN